jgi:hypothetical protein
MQAAARVGHVKESKLSELVKCVAETAAGYAVLRERLSVGENQLVVIDENETALSLMCSPSPTHEKQ